MPSAHTPSQKASIAQFVGFTQAKDSAAAKHLKAHGWNVEQAVDAVRFHRYHLVTDMDKETSPEPGEIVEEPQQTPKEAPKEQGKTQELGSISENPEAANTNREVETHKRRVQNAWQDVDRMIRRMPLDKDGTTFWYDEEYDSWLLQQSQNYSFDYEVTKLEERSTWLKNCRQNVLKAENIALHNLFLRLHMQSEAIGPTHTYAELPLMYRFALKRPLMSETDMVEASRKLRLIFEEDDKEKRAPEPFEEVAPNAGRVLHDGVAAIWGLFRRGQIDFANTLDEFRSILGVQKASDEELAWKLRDLDVPLTDYLGKDDQLHAPENDEPHEELLRDLTKLTARYLNAEVNLNMALDSICDRLEGLVVNRKYFAEYLEEARKRRAPPRVPADYICTWASDESVIGDADIADIFEQFEAKYHLGISSGLDPRLALSDFVDETGLEDDFSEDQVSYMLHRLESGPKKPNERPKDDYTEGRWEPKGIAMGPPKGREKVDLFGFVLLSTEGRRIARELNLPSDLIDKRVRSSTPQLSPKRRRSSTSMTSEQENSGLDLLSRDDQGAKRQKREHTPFAREDEDHAAFVQRNFPGHLPRSRGDKRPSSVLTPYPEYEGGRNEFADMALLREASERLSEAGESELSRSSRVHSPPYVESALRRSASPALPSTEVDLAGHEQVDDRAESNKAQPINNPRDDDGIFDFYNDQFMDTSKPNTLVELLMIRIFDHEIFKSSHLRGEEDVGNLAEELLRELKDYFEVGAVDPPSSDKDYELICLVARITMLPTRSNVEALRKSVTRDELEEPPVELDLGFFEADSSVHVLLSYFGTLEDPSLSSRQSPEPMPSFTEPSSILSTPMSTRQPSPRPNPGKTEADRSAHALSAFLQGDSSNISVDPSPSELNLTKAQALGDFEAPSVDPMQITDPSSPNTGAPSRPGSPVRGRRRSREPPRFPEGHPGSPFDLVDTARIQRCSSFVQFRKQRAKRKKANVREYDDSYFQNSSSNTGSSTSSSALNKLFDKYRDKTDPDADTVGVEGSMRYLGDLGVQLDEPVLLAVLTDINAPTMGEMTRQGFLDGWKSLNATDLSSQKNIIRTYRRDLSSPQADLFRRTYKYTFRLALPTGQKTLPLENATEYWRLLLASPAVNWYSPPTTSTKTETQWLDLWLEYLETKWKKGVSRDMWEQMGKFVGKTMESGGEDMGWWSEDGAWPGVVDGFVEFVRGKRGEGGDNMEE